MQCVLYNDTVALLSKEWRRTGVNLPALNIGVLYFKATAAVVRCVYNWLYDMRGAAEERAAFWDQVRSGAPWRVGHASDVAPC